MQSAQAICSLRKCGCGVVCRLVRVQQGGQGSGATVQLGLLGVRLREGLGVHDPEGGGAVLSGSVWVTGVPRS